MLAALAVHGWPGVLQRRRCCRRGRASHGRTVPNLRAAAPGDSRAARPALAMCGTKSKATSTCRCDAWPVRTTAWWVCKEAGLRILAHASSKAAKRAAKGQHTAAMRGSGGVPLIIAKLLRCAVSFALAHCLLPRVLLASGTCRAGGSVRIRPAQRLDVGQRANKQASKLQYRISQPSLAMFAKPLMHA